MIQCDKKLSKFWRNWDKKVFLVPKTCSLLSFSTTAGLSVTWSADAFEGLQGEMLLFFSLTRLLIILSS